MSEKYAFNPEDIDKLEMDKYADKYSEDDLWKKVSKTAAKVGAKVIYQALLLFYVAQSPACPMKIKAGIIAALGYFISPIDRISYPLRDIRMMRRGLPQPLWLRICISPMIYAHRQRRRSSTSSAKRFWSISKTERLFYKRGALSFWTSLPRV